MPSDTDASTACRPGGRPAAVGPLGVAKEELEALHYAISHDLGASARVALGYARFLLEDHGAALGADARGLVSEVIAAADQLETRIGALCEIISLMSATVRPERLDLSGLARERLERLAEADASVRSWVVVAGGMAVYADPFLLPRVLDELLANAVRFAALGDAPRVAVYATEADGEACFAVADNGPGFDMRYASRLFRPFQRMHGDPRLVGDGVGLAVVRTIVQRHGGRVWADARIGGGATFYVNLPPGTAAGGRPQ